MKTRSKISDSGKIRVRAYVGACAAWAAGGYEALADVQHGYFDPVSKNSVTVAPEGPLYGESLGIAGMFNFVVDARAETEQNVNSAFVVGSRSDGNGGFLASDLALSFTSMNTTGKQLMDSVVLGYNYYGYALRRYADGDVIDGQAILDASGTELYTAGYLFQFDQPTGGPQAGEFNQTNFDGYLGFAFTDATVVHTGWIFVESIGNDYRSFKVLDWYYTAGNTVGAGDGRPPLEPQETVPEPSSLGLLAVGAAGVLRYRRRRKTTEAAIESNSAA